MARSFSSPSVTAIPSLDLAALLVGTPGCGRPCLTPGTLVLAAPFATLSRWPGTGSAMRPRHRARATPINLSRHKGAVKITQRFWEQLNAR